MTISKDASGADRASDVSAAEPAVAEKKASTRKTASPAKKTTSKKPTKAAAKTVKEASPAPVAEPAVSSAEAAEAPKKTSRSTTRKSTAKAAKSSPKKADDTAPVGSVAAAVQAAEAEKAAAPQKAKAAARTSRAKKAAPPAPVDEQGEARAPAKERQAPSKAAEPVKSEVAASEPATVKAAVESAPAGDSQSVADEAKASQKTASSRRRRGSRGKGKSSSEQAKAEAAGLQMEGGAQLALEAQQLPALEGSNALALPAGEVHLAIDVQDAPIPLGTGEQNKKGRRRKRGKSNGNGNGSAEAARTENGEANVEVEEGADAKPARGAKAASKGKRKMFVSVLAGEQVEVVISEEGQLREYYVEMLHHQKIKGNIYKGVIHNVDPNLQAAFVSYGSVKNGFLQIDEVHPEYYLTPHEQGKGHKYPLIQKVLKAGQEILVQVVKEPSGTKGAFLTSYLSIPGRYLVLTPGREQIGVSRKVGNDSERSRLREMLDGLNPGEGLGVIVRTVSEGASKTNLQRDLQFLKRVWRDVRKKGSTDPAPALIYQELGLAARAVRDYLTEDVIELWVNDATMASEMSEVIAMLFPKRKSILQLHDDSSQSLFERFGLAKQITQVQSREVVLPSGGRLVFDQTEALMAIDINSGRTGGKNNFEDMAFKINLEAAQNIPLQLRLRDIGGQVVVDFIEMRDRSHWHEVEKAFRNGMKEDRARHDVGKISSFGLLEVVRQRLGSSAISIASEPCPFCKGTGIRRNMEWQAMQAMQDIQQMIRQNNESGKTIVYSAGAELILYLLNSKKEWLLDMEQENNIKLELHPGM